MNIFLLTLMLKVGFVNPTLYAHPEVLNDIVNGSNPNCGSSGFKTAPGWDPVSPTPSHGAVRQSTNRSCYLGDWAGHA